MPSEHLAGPLNGVRVLDLTSVLLGPFATQLLAGMGADVTKLEPPAGDISRHIGPMRNEAMGAIFLHANRGKRSVVLDMKQPGGQQAVHKLLSSHDVLVSNIRVAAMKKLGLDYAALAPRYPGLIVVNCVGFSGDGPYAGRPAYDDLIQGASGVPTLMQRHGTPGPMYTPMTLADRVTGLHTTYAITAALYEREKTGKGQQVEVPMFECMAHFVLGDHMGGATFDSESPTSAQTGYNRPLAPFRRPYETRDGYLCVLIYNDKQWERFFAAIGQPDRTKTDPMFADHVTRTKNVATIYELVADIVRENTTSYWQQLLDKADIPNAPLNTVETLLDDPHLKAVGLLDTEQHPSQGEIRALRNPVRFAGTAPALASPAPRLGEHTREVLLQTGMTAQQVDELIGDGTAIQAP